MAFFGTPSTTAGTILGSTVPHFFQKVMLEWMRPEFRFYTYATKKPLPNNYGRDITFNRKVALNYGYMLSQGVPVSAIKTLSANQVSALIEQIGDSVGVSDIAQLATVMDSDAYALEVMADQAANSVEQYIIENIMADTVVNHYVKKGAAIAQGSNAAKASAASATRLAMSDVRAVATNLMTKNVKPYDGQNYVMIAHPYQISDIMGDTTFSNWVSYTQPEHMQNFELGKIYNVRVVPSTKVPISTGSAYSACCISTLTGSAIKVYGAVMFGADAYAVTELGGGIQTYKSTGASKADPLNQVDAYGWKINLASKVINPSAIEVIWTSQDEVIRNATLISGNIASGVSALGINCLFPSTATSVGAYYGTIMQSW
jgi:N4-gp56 family major capsid protein